MSIQNYGRTMHAKCKNCGSTVFLNKWFTDDNTYVYTCVECNTPTRVNYPAHRAEKRTHGIRKVVGFDVVKNTLTVRDDHSVTLDLVFEPDSIQQLISTLREAQLIENQTDLPSLRPDWPVEPAKDFTDLPCVRFDPEAVAKEKWPIEPPEGRELRTL